MSHQNPTEIPKNLVWHQTNVTRDERAQFFQQQPVTLWLTGLSGAGKSTLACALEKRLLELGQASYVLDGDNVRHGLNRDLGFSPEHRTENIRRISEVARLMNEAGLIVITAFISPYRADRELARSVIGADNFLEVHVSTPLETCEARDPKGFYQKARAGKMPGFTGVSAPYEAPDNPVLVVDTTSNDIETCIEMVLSILLPRINVN